MVRQIGLIAILWIFVIEYLPFANAETEQLLPDVRVLIDVSGSMKRNDPNNLRQPALELLVELLPDGGKAGVWTFGKYVNMLVPHKPINNEWRRTAKKAAATIKSVALYTNIGEAIEKASFDYQNPKPGFKTSFILLTDGVVDISRDPDVNSKERNRIINQHIARLKQMGASLHTISLSKNADHELMERLAVATDGVAAVAGSADELMKIFVKAFDQAAPAEQVPLAENKFLVDSSIEEFTALVYRQQSSLETKMVGPDQKVYSKSSTDDYIKWHHGEAYDLITVQQPLEGEWQIAADTDPDNRVTIVSNLSMQVSPINNNLFGNIPTLSMQLKEEGKTITRKEFLSLLNVDLRVTRDRDDKIWEQSLPTMKPPVNGIFKADLTMLSDEGDYNIELKIDGKTFQREYAKRVTVRAPYKVTIEEDNGLNGDMLVISMIPLESELDNSASTVMAKLTMPNGETQVLPLEPSGDQVWRLNIPPNGDGNYSAEISIKGVDKAGTKIIVNTPTVSHHYQMEKSPLEEQPVEPEPIPEPEPILETESISEPAPPEPEVVTEVTPAPVPVAEPEPEPEPAVEQVEEQPSEEEAGINWLLWGGIGFGNLLVGMLGFFAYRLVSKNKPQSLEELDEDIDDDLDEDFDIDDDMDTDLDGQTTTVTAVEDTVLDDTVVDDTVMDETEIEQTVVDDTEVEATEVETTVDNTESTAEELLTEEADDEEEESNLSEISIDDSDEDDDDFDFDDGDEYSLDDFALDDDEED